MPTRWRVTPRSVRKLGLVPIRGTVKLLRRMVPTASSDCEVVNGDGARRGRSVLICATLDAHHVLFEGMLLKPNMVIAGKQCAQQASDGLDVAE